MTETTTIVKSSPATSSTARNSDDHVAVIPVPFRSLHQTKETKTVNNNDWQTIGKRTDAWIRASGRIVDRKVRGDHDDGHGASPSLCFRPHVGGPKRSFQGVRCPQCPDAKGYLPGRTPEHVCRPSIVAPLDGRNPHGSWPLRLNEVHMIR
jgi:hypothetical protein